MATWKIRIISDGLLSKIPGSCGSSAPSRTTKFGSGALPPASMNTGLVLRRLSSRAVARCKRRSVSLRISLACAWYWCISASTAG